MSDERASYIAQSLEDEKDIEQSTDVEFRDPIKQLGFARIDHILTLDESLSDGAYRTYALLIYYWQKKTSAWPKVETMSKIRGVKESTLRGHLKELKDAGLISRQRRMGRSSITYLEDLPERYEAAAKSVLTDRRNKSGKTAKNLAVRPPNNRLREEEPIEEESKKDCASKNDAPTPSKEEIPFTDMPVPEADSHASELADEFDAMPSASGAPQERTAGVADPREDWREFKAKYLSRACAVLGHETDSGTDRAALKRMWQMSPGKFPEFLAHIENGGGAEFRKPGATMFWVSNKFDDWKARGFKPLSHDQTEHDNDTARAALAR